MANQQDFEVFSGNDKVLRVTLLDAVDGTPVSLVGVLDITWALAKDAGKTAKITKTLVSGVTITDATNGECEVTLDNADLEPLVGEYYHEMRVTDSSGKKTTVMYGTVTIDLNLIRS